MAVYSSGKSLTIEEDRDGFYLVKENYPRDLHNFFSKKDGWTRQLMERVVEFDRSRRL